MDSHKRRNISSEQHAQPGEGYAPLRVTPDSSLPEVCVGSNDDIWADLLARNLSARGIATTRCDLNNLRDHIASVAEGSWVVLDGGWPMLELQSAVEDLNPLLSQPHINTVVVVDELVGPHPLSSLTPDTFISRSSDMRVFVRELLALFQSFVPARPSTT